MILDPDRLKAGLEKLYADYNRVAYLHPDPLELVYPYRDTKDREIVALVASCLAYGRVAQILRSVSAVLDRMGSAARFVDETSPAVLRGAFAGFRHRFATGRDLGALLCAIKAIRETYGSLNACFRAGMARAGRDENEETVVPALAAFVDALVRVVPDDVGHLLARPGRGSACKRLHLFLRWMVRRDAVDPGGWEGIPASRLVVPLDVHMHRICGMLGLTESRQASLRTALEITRGFRVLCPEDPVKYDFVLTRLGIRTEMDPRGFMRDYLGCEGAG